MTSENTDNIRAATFLAAQERQDLRGFKATQTGKTNRRNINCKPPNKQCGGRCIPPNWDCRLKGEGTNSELKAHKSDPLAGIASIQRGAKDLRQGILKLDPNRVQRGRSSVIRGAVKLAPGDNLEKKKQLKKRLTEASTPVMAVLGVTLLGLASHAAMKRAFPEYRNGWGSDIDRAAARGVDRVLDITPVVGGNRAARRAAGAAAVTGVAVAVTRGARLQTMATRAADNTRRIGPLSFRPGAMDTASSHLVENLNRIQGEARNRRYSYEQWLQPSVESLYGATAPGTRRNGRQGSVFSEHAANEFLVSKFGLNTRGQAVGAVGAGGDFSMSARNRQTEDLLADHLGRWGDALREDMRLRRYTGPNGQIRMEDINRYITEVGDQILGSSFDGLPARRRPAARVEANRLIRSVIRNTNHAPQAHAMRVGLVNEYDNYFRDTALRMQRNAAAADSPFGDGVVGLARYVTRRNPVQILSRDHADLVLRHHYHSHVMRQRSPFTIGDGPARRIAQQITRSPEQPSTSDAFQILRDHGFPQIQRAGAAGTTPTAPPPALTGTERPARRPARPRTEAELIRIFSRAGYSPEGARAQARRVIEERQANRSRGDAGEERLGKPCGQSFIPKQRKCHQTTGSTPAAPSAPERGNGNKVKLALAIGGAATAGALLAAYGINQAKVKDYRSHVSDSALKAETLAKEMMDEMRQDAARRLGKDIKDVTGFEASVYNFKDPGHDRGFGALDLEPAYFGQTPNSRGAVVMLSYADDDRFTRRGQGSYRMATGGAFQEIWGEHDVLPFANNISQPSRRSPDDISVNAREELIRKSGPFGKAVRGAATVKEAAGNFEYLSENINQRGHNPDAIRAAAFVVAQRRLTGKPVHVMSYSNGGNVASETLAILREMGYRDVKVANVAGPTFGVFKHSPDNMRTWVSPGDEFWKMGRGAAFQGSNVRLLRNPNIPHGLTAKIDPNNRENGAGWKQNVKQKNSYLLDEQLQQEAFRFLTVDKRRSRELTDEFIWRVAEKKGMEGDLNTLLGPRASSVEAAYLSRRKANREAADAWLREEVEKQMISSWYGGYDPKAVKARQRQIKKDLQEQISGKRTDSAQTKGKKCGNSYIPKQNKCQVNAAKTQAALKTAAKVALVAGAVAGGVAISKRLKTKQEWDSHPQNPRNNPKLSDAEADRLIKEAIEGGQKWDVQEQINARRQSQCNGGSGKLQAPAKFDSWQEARCYVGGGAYGMYYVHTSGKYGIKTFLEDSTDANIEKEFDIQGYAKYLGVSTPEVLKLRKDAIVMEHLEGFEPLAQRFGRGLSASNSTRLERLNLIRAIRPLHEGGIAHRDLHPGNVLYNPSTRKFALVDYGLAMRNTGEATEFNFDNKGFAAALRMDLKDMADLVDAPRPFRQRWERSLLALHDDVARNPYDFDRAEFVIRRYYDDMERAIKATSPAIKPRSRFIQGVDQPRIPGLDNELLEAPFRKMDPEGARMIKSMLRQPEQGTLRREMAKAVGVRTSAMRRFAGVPSPKPPARPGTATFKRQVSAALGTFERDQRLGRALQPPSPWLDARNDAAKRSSGKGKKCGNSFIPKQHKCGEDDKTKERLKTAAKIALGAGLVAGTAYAVKRSGVTEFHTGLSTGTSGDPVRKRRFGHMVRNQQALGPDEIAASFEGLKRQPGVIPENVEALQNFIKKRGIKNDPATFFEDVKNGIIDDGKLTESQRKAALGMVRTAVELGAIDGMASQYSNNIFVRSMRTDRNALNAKPEDVIKAASTFMDRRAANRDVTPKDALFKQLFAVSKNTSSGDAAEQLNNIHEIAHKVHFQASFNAGINAFDIGEKGPYQPAIKGLTSNLLINELGKVTSEYGRSDLLGRRAETFAELSVLYVTQGVRFQKEHPYAYQWVDAIWKKANE